MGTPENPTTPTPTPTPCEIFTYAWNAVEQELAEHHQGKEIFPKEILWLNGTPGAGKGTHSETIRAHKHFSAKSIEMSSLFKTPEAQEIMKKGLLIDDKMATTLLFRELSKPQYRDGVIMDGYPRTAAQGEILKLLNQKLIAQGTPSHFQIVELVVDEETSVARQLQRGNEALEHNKEVERTGVGVKYETRTTDLDQALAHKRYKVFIEQTYLPLKALGDIFPFYTIETTGTIEEMSQKITETIG